MIFSHIDNINQNKKGFLMSKISYKYALIILITVVSLGASQVGSLITFDANTTAKAAEVNSNFANLRTGVNDNDTELTTKQNRVVATGCAGGSSIRVINEDGTVICELDTDSNSGGDITAVIAGTGLAGGGLNGDVSLK